MIVWYLRSINCCDINPDHQLLAVGTTQVCVKELWKVKRENIVVTVIIIVAVVKFLIAIYMKDIVIWSFHYLEIWRFERRFLFGKFLFTWFVKGQIFLYHFKYSERTWLCFLCTLHYTYTGNVTLRYCQFICSCYCIC